MTNRMVRAYLLGLKKHTDGLGYPRVHLTVHTAAGKLSGALKGVDFDNGYIELITHGADSKILPLAISEQAIIAIQGHLLDT